MQESADTGQLHDLVLKLYREGKYDEAIPLALEELALREEALGKEHLDVADTLNNLAMLYRETGDYVRAEPLYKRALWIRERNLAPDDPRIATTLSHLGQLNRLKGDYVEAELLYRRALAIREKTLGADDPFVATSLSNLALVYTYLEDYSQAESLYRRALKIYADTVGSDDIYYASTLGNLAGVYWQKGDQAQAAQLLEQALDIEEKRLGSEHPDVAQSLSNLATVYTDKGDLAKAELLYRRALAIREKTLGSKHPLVASLLSNLSLLYEAKGDSAQAVALQTRANDIREYGLEMLLGTGSEGQKRRYLSALAGESAGTISLHVNFAPENPQAVRMALTTMLRRKGRVLDAMSEQIGSLRRHLRPEDAELLDKLEQKRGRLATLILQGVGGHDAKQYRDEVAELGDEIQRLEETMSMRSAEFRSQSQPVTLERVQSAIPADAALVEFASYRPFNAQAKTRAERWKPARYIAYVLKRAGAPGWVELKGEAAAIDDQMRKLRAALRNPARQDVRDLARALDELVMRPLRAMLGETRRVFLSPDGALNLVPFGALISEQGHFLVESYSFTYLTSGRDLLRFSTRSVGGLEPMVIASPAFDQPLSLGDVRPEPILNQAGNHRPPNFQEHFQTLAGTLAEGEELGRMLGVKPLVKEQATEASLKQVSGPTILHVATHGFFLTRQPSAAPSIDQLGSFSMLPTDDESENPLLRSGLALAGANQLQGGGGEDGVLTALEASGLDLWGTRLVALSACETGLGDVQNWEGVYGLRRALVLSGAESQVLSLWKVNEEATRELMVRYYKRLMAGEGRSEALRQVQLELLATKDRSHPYFWAGFIPQGDWKNLKGEEGRGKSVDKVKIR